MNNGIRGEQAGTTLRAALIRLSDPPKEAANTLEHLGVQITDSHGKMLPFSNIIGQLSEKTKNMANAQKLAALSTIFGTEAASGMLTVIEAGPQKLDSLTKSLQNSSGASKEAAEKMKNNLKGALEELGGAIETAQISIGDALAPAIQVVAEALQGLFNAFNSLPEGMKQFIAIGAAISAVLLGVVATIGVVLSIVGTAMQGFGALASVLASAGGMAGFFSSAIAVITGPIGIAIGAIAGLVAVGVVLYKNWDEIKAKATEIWGAISQWFSVTLESIKQFFTQSWTNIKDFTSATWENIKQTTETVWNAIKDGVMAIITPFINGITNLFNGMKSGLQTIFEGLKQYFNGVWQLIKNIFLGAVLLIVDLVTGDFEALKNDAKAIFENLKNALFSIWNGIKSIFSGAVQAIKGFVNAAWENIKSNTSIVFNAVKSTISSIWEGIKSFFATTVENIKATISNGFENMKSAVSEKMTAAKSKIEEIWNQAKSFLEGINLYEIGRNIIQGLIDGISSMASALWKKAKAIADMVKNTIRDALDINSPSRVMRDEIGKWIPLGLAEGIEKNINAVVSATNRMAQATIPDAISQYNPSNSKASVNQHMSNTTLNFDRMFEGANFYISSKEDAVMLGREISRYTIQKAKAAGVRL